MDKNESWPAPGAWPPERIRALRKHLGLNQTEMAERLGYSRQQTISELEKDARPASPQVCIILSLYAERSGFEG